ncbi:MAG: YjjG family noncanonical pyrimidine nucleotidase [Cyclobacteriaceae bacterium]
MREVRHIFFDLDHTLWDYDRNAQETLSEIYFEINDQTVSLKKFIKTFYEVNEKLWHRYNHGQIERKHIREERFIQVFKKTGFDPSKAEESSEYFIENCSKKPHLFPYAKSTLDYLIKKYKLHIITNGFDDIQPRKLKSSGIDSYFEMIITSESNGSRKPSPEIFQLAVDRAGTTKNQSVMIGDNPKVDIHGARDFGMRTILFDPSGKRRSMADYSIQSLSELINIL